MLRGAPDLPIIFSCKWRQAPGLALRCIDAGSLELASGVDIEAVHLPPSFLMCLQSYVPSQVADIHCVGLGVSWRLAYLFRYTSNADVTERRRDAQDKLTPGFLPGLLIMAMRLVFASTLSSKG
jgi:hypothetical protein